MKILEKLRPQGETAAALTEALDRTVTALAEAEGRLADMQARRGAALLAGGATAERHEAALRDVREEAERLAALRNALSDKRAEAERRESRQRLETLAAETAAAARSAGQAIAREYPKLARRMAELLAAERDALAAIDRLTAELAQAPAEDAETIALPPPPRAFYGTRPEDCGIALTLVPLCDVARLPKHDSADLGWPHAARWWPAG